MKNKKLLILLAIVVVVVVVIVVLASVFSVRQVYLSYHTFNGDLTTAPDGGVPSEVVEKLAKGKSTIFLSKTNLLTQLNAQLKENYPDWHAFAVVKSFPNILEIHLVKRTAIAKFQLTSGDFVYIDSFGCVVEQAPLEDTCIDITQAFSARDKAPEQPADGTFKFATEAQNARLKYVLEAILATWQCYVEIDEMDVVFNAGEPFKFDNEGSMIINLHSGGTIRLLSPDTDLTARLIKAYGVYFNSDVNLQGDEWEITVYKNGRISTPDPKK